VWRGQPESNAIEEDLMGVSVYPLDSSRVEFAPPWLSFSNSLCAMTGLASDVEQVCRILQRQVDGHFNVYDDNLPVHSMTERVGELLHQATISKGGRPFGVQTILVGGSDIDRAKKFCLYTIDPSGSWQSWPWGTSIGKFAKEVRTELAKKLESPPSSLKEALEQIIESWIETCKEQNVNIKSEEDFQVLILRAPTDSTTCKVYKMKRDDIDAMVKNAASLATGN
jgi:20S proteasome alpha/beta subunit